MGDLQTRHAMRAGDLRQELRGRWTSCFSFVDGEVKLWDLQHSDGCHPSGVRCGLTKPEYNRAYSKTPRGIANAKLSRARTDAKAYEVGGRISLLESEAVQTGAVLI